MREIVIDSFAGGGGASEGIRAATGRDPDIAINHDALALAMHRINHPDTHHIVEDVWSVDPRGMCGNRPVGMLWLSPDCKHFSKAKGGKPRDKAIRGLAWVAQKWVRALPAWQRPRVVFLENVEEFQDWGPLTEDGHPCPVQKGATFKLYVDAWRALGYRRVEWRELRACDYGAPTIRKRLFLIARRDGSPIVWPEPTHGPPDHADVLAGRRKPWRTAAEIIDWSLPCPSIFETSEEIKAKHGVRAIRPLAEATLARIAKGVRRYVLDAARPFIVPITHTGSVRVHDSAEPLRTITTARRGELAVAAPFVAKHNTGSVGADARAPLATVTSHSGEARGGGAAPLGVVAPVLVSTTHGDSGGRREYPLGEPIGTVTGAREHALARATLVAAYLAQHNTDLVGHDARAPVSTIVGKGCTQGIVEATLAAGHLNWAYTSNTRGGEGDLDRPCKTLLAGGNHAALVAAFLAKYYGSGSPAQAADDPLHTVATKPHHGVVTVSIAGEPYVVVDIGMRMLTPRERFNAQGFRPDYVIDRGLLEGGREIALTAEAQGRMCGNSVCPPIAEALVRANYQPMERAVPAPAAVPLFAEEVG